MKAFAKNSPQRSLTPIQAKTLANISILGCTDLSYNNLYFTQDGKVALIDTEPHKRALKKICKSSSLFFFLVIKDLYYAYNPFPESQGLNYTQITLSR